jgi:hypothetical protein
LDRRTDQQEQRQQQKSCASSVPPYSMLVITPNGLSIFADIISLPRDVRGF